MSADLHIHVLTKKFTEKHVEAFQSNSLGTRFFNLGYDKRFEKEHDCDLYKMCAATPDVWVGEVSWLKANVLEDEESFIPNIVQAVWETVGENFPVIDDSFIEAIKKAFEAGNTTDYSVSSVDKVVSFLTKHLGKKVFTISW